jgi:hypothetical protein
MTVVEDVIDAVHRNIYVTLDPITVIRYVDFYLPWSQGWHIEDPYTITIILDLHDGSQIQRDWRTTFMPTDTTPLETTIEDCFPLPENCWIDGYGYPGCCNLNYIITIPLIWNTVLADLSQVGGQQLIIPIDKYTPSVECGTEPTTTTTTTTQEPTTTTTTTQGPTTTTQGPTTTTLPPTTTKEPTVINIPCPCYKRVPTTLFSRPPYKLPTTINVDTQLRSVDVIINNDIFSGIITTNPPKKEDISETPTTIPPTTTIYTYGCIEKCKNLKF